MHDYLNSEDGVCVQEIISVFSILEGKKEMHLIYYFHPTNLTT